MKKLSEYAKAVAAFLGTVVGALLLVMESNGYDDLGDLTQVQWLLVLATVLGTAGAVAAVPNAGFYRIKPGGED